MCNALDLKLGHLGIVNYLITYHIKKMDNLLNHNKLDTIIGNWDWQPRKLKEQFGQLTLSDVTYVFGKENDMLTRIRIRLNKSHYQVIRILTNLRS
jgi:hypothetical protein